MILILIIFETLSTKAKPDIFSSTYKRMFSKPIEIKKRDENREFTRIALQESRQCAY